MSLTGDTWEGWTITPGANIIVDGEEITVKEIIDEVDDIIEVEAVSPMGDYDRYYLGAFDVYEEWGY